MGQERTERAGELGSDRESLEGFVSSVDAFQETIGRLNERYRDLEKRYLEINRQLELTNRRLQTAADENRRFGEYLDCILQGIDIGITAVDEHGIIRFFNPAAEKLLDRSARQVIGLTFADSFPDIDRELSAVESGCASCEIRRACEHAGKMLELSISVLPIPGDRGVLGGIYVVRDLTAVRELDRERSRLKTMAALGEMSATLAHEIRNPLTGIAGHSGLLIRELPPGLPKKWAEKIEEGVHRLERLIMNMLEFARSPRLDRRPICWRTFGREIANAFESGIIKKKISLVRKFPRQWPQSIGDASLLRQAVVNLLHNAEQAVDEEGEIELLIAATDDDSITIEVSDNGPGMDDRTLAELFRPFFTTREQGTGLGLAIARKIVEAHGGTIAAESLLGQGSRFKIILPSYR